MKINVSRSKMQWLRRLSQGFFLLLFLVLVVSARLSEVDANEQALRLFFDFDPLVSLASIIASRALSAGALLALSTVILTLFFGRVFCGWFCPLGTVHTLASACRPKRKKQTEIEARTPWHRAKYILLVALLIMALFGVHWIGIFDPISLLYRTTTTAIWPGLQYAVEDGATTVYQADPHLGPLHATSLTEPVYRFFRDHLFRGIDRQVFQSSSFIAFFFIFIVGLNFIKPRFWCRYVCPLGGLLGLLSQWPLLRLNNHRNQCKHCGQCNLACPAAAQPDQRGKWLPSECFVCWNCVSACKFEGLKFELESVWVQKKTGALDLSRRHLIAGGAAGAASMIGFRVTPQIHGKPFPEKLIRPPGARAEADFLHRCLQCGLCMRACPTNGLQPTLLEGGLEALWTPRLVPKIGYCEFNCTLCGQVCPTGAIEALPIKEKQQVKIGLATVDRSRCLPWAYGRECLVCEEHCPLSPKAIYLIEEEVEVRGGKTRKLGRPYVDPDRCIGCGVCEYACVYLDKAAIRLTAANESRHPKNQPILPDFSSDYDGESESSDPYGGGGETGSDDAYGGESSPYG